MKHCDGKSMQICPFQRAFGWWKKAVLFAEIHPGVACLNYVGQDGCARYCAAFVTRRGKYCEVFPN